MAEASGTQLQQDITGPYAQNWTTFTNAMSARGRPIGQVRMMVPWNAVYTANTQGQCVNSYDWKQAPNGGGGGEWAAFLAGLIAAQSKGYQVLVSISPGSAAAQAAFEPIYPDVTSNQQQLSDYECGIKGLIAVSDYVGVHVNQWEAFNEPDGACAYNNATVDGDADDSDPGADTDGSGGQPDGDSSCYARGTSTTTCGPNGGTVTGGAAKAACLYVRAVNTITAASGHSGDTVAAGAFSHQSPGYVSAYITLLQAQNVIPKVWSVHDYADPTGSGWFGNNQATDLTAFNANISLAYPFTAPETWVTEASVELTHRDTTYNGTNVDCHPFESDNEYTLGACVDGYNNALAAGANGWLNLGATTGGGNDYPNQTTRVYWYQFESGPPGQNSGFDAALYGPGGSPRGSGCVLEGTWPTCGTNRAVYYQNANDGQHRTPYWPASGYYDDAKDWSIPNYSINEH